MTPRLIEPTDVLFFRDAVPMSAGQGRGAGCRLPFPSTLHEAFRASLLRSTGNSISQKEVTGRPRHAPKRGNWHGRACQEEDRRMIATSDFRSLRTIGPFPWHVDKGLLLPVPADVAFETNARAVASAAHMPQGVEHRTLRRMELWLDGGVPVRREVQLPSDFRPLCLPMAVTPPDKHGQLSGWWSTTQYSAYLGGSNGESGHKDQVDQFFRPLPTDHLWSAEHRVGVQIDPVSLSAAQGQLYAGTYLRADRKTRFMAWAEIADPAMATNGEAAARARERAQLDSLDWLLLGGEFRLARVWQKSGDGKPILDLLGDLRCPPAPPPGDGPCLLKWVLVTPAIFAHGSLPGWCWNKGDDRPAGEVRLGASKRKASLEAFPGRAQLVSWCLAKPRTVSGFDVVEGRAKPTMLAVPEGGVYYFLCENRATAIGSAKTPLAAALRLLRRKRLRLWLRQLRRPHALHVPGRPDSGQGVI